MFNLQCTYAGILHIENISESHIKEWYTFTPSIHKQKLKHSGKKNKPPWVWEGGVLVPSVLVIKF